MPPEVRRPGRSAVTALLASALLGAGMALLGARWMDRQLQGELGLRPPVAVLDPGVVLAAIDPAHPPSPVAIKAALAQLQGRGHQLAAAGWLVLDAGKLAAYPPALVIPPPPFASDTASTEPAAPAASGDAQ